MGTLNQRRAPSRSTLMEGRHTGHCSVRGNQPPQLTDRSLKLLPAALRDGVAGLESLLPGLMAELAVIAPNVQIIMAEVPANYQEQLKKGNADFAAFLAVETERDIVAERRSRQAAEPAVEAAPPASPMPPAPAPEPLATREALAKAARPTPA